MAEQAIQGTPEEPGHAVAYGDGVGAGEAGSADASDPDEEARTELVEAPENAAVDAESKG